VRRVDPETTSFIPGEAWVTDTDDHGEFRVGSLPGGRFAVTLTARPTLSVGFLEKLYPEIDRRTFVDLRAGQELPIARVFEDPDSSTSGGGAADGIAPQPASVDPRSAAIEGRLLAANGRPLAGLSISIIPLATAASASCSQTREGGTPSTSCPRGRCRSRPEVAPGSSNSG
jgi:hypothetical protein